MRLSRLPEYVAGRARPDATTISYLEHQTLESLQLNISLAEVKESIEEEERQQLVRCKQARLEYRREPEFIEIAPIVGPEAMEVHSLTMETMQSTRPSRKIRDGISKLGPDAHDLPPMDNEVFESLLEYLEELHDFPDQEAVYKNTREQLASLSDHGDILAMQNYVMQQANSEVIQTFIRENETDLEAVSNEIRNLYALEHSMSSNPAVQRKSIPDILDKYGLAPWPNTSIRPENKDIQPLLPHQLVGKSCLLPYYSMTPLSHLR